MSNLSRPSNQVVVEANPSHSGRGILWLAILVILFIVARSFVYIVNEQEQVIITRFGNIVGEPVKQPGLHFRTPFVQTVVSLDKRVLEWDGQNVEMPTKDLTYIEVETYARWQIEDAKKFFITLRDERSAQSRLNDILGGETRKEVANYNLIELVRTDKNIKIVPAAVTEGVSSANVVPVVEFGREFVEGKIRESAAKTLEAFGIRLLDIRFKRINYNERVVQNIYQRMISERQQIAKKFISEGNGAASNVLGQKERDLQKIDSEAYRKVLETKGKADATATEIYAKAYTQSPLAAEFYGFLKTMEMYEQILGKETTLVLSTDSDLLRYIKGSGIPKSSSAAAPAANGSAPAPAPVATPPAAAPVPPAPGPLPEAPVP